MCVNCHHACGVKIRIWTFILHCKSQPREQCGQTPNASSFLLAFQQKKKTQPIKHEAGTKSYQARHDENKGRIEQRKGTLNDRAHVWLQVRFWVFFPRFMPFWGSAISDLGFSRLEAHTPSRKATKHRLHIPFSCLTKNTLFTCVCGCLRVSISSVTKAIRRIKNPRDRKPGSGRKPKVRPP